MVDSEQIFIAVPKKTRGKSQGLFVQIRKQMSREKAQATLLSFIGKRMEPKATWMQGEDVVAALNTFFQKNLQRTFIFSPCFKAR